jgi:hypothetical protein
MRPSQVDYAWAIEEAEYVLDATLRGWTRTAWPGSPPEEECSGTPSLEGAAHEDGARCRSPPEGRSTGGVGILAGVALLSGHWTIESWLRSPGSSVAVGRCTS